MLLPLDCHLPVYDMMYPLPMVVTETLTILTPVTIHCHLSPATTTTCHYHPHCHLPLATTATCHYHLPLPQLPQLPPATATPPQLRADFLRGTAVRRIELEHNGSDCGSDSDSDSDTATATATATATGGDTATATATGGSTDTDTATVAVAETGSGSGAGTGAGTGSERQRRTSAIQAHVRRIRSETIDRGCRSFDSRGWAVKGKMTAVMWRVEWCGIRGVGVGIDRAGCGVAI
jgi:hypothetical protein